MECMSGEAGYREKQGQLIHIGVNTGNMGKDKGRFGIGKVM